MKDKKSGIEAYVRLLCSEDPCEEWLPPPDSSLERRKNINECWIEAVPGERVQFGVIIPPEFKFLTSTHLEVAYNVDEKFLKGLYVAKDEVKEPAICELAESPVLIDGVWQNRGFMLEPLEIDDEHAFSSEETVGEHQRSFIRITLRRGKAYDDIPVGDTHWIGFDPALRSNTSTKMASKMGRTHMLKMVDLGPPQPVPNMQTPWMDAKGDAGKPIVFKFYYTSPEFIISQGMERIHSNDVDQPLRRRRKRKTAECEKP